MALTPGTRLGVYEVTVQIGEGGMGQVWRARDTKLNREVALKVLPDSLANDTDRLARFTREAQTLAALNHPNIAHIHGLEESSGVRALVMELVEGDDLSQRIARGAIPLDEALPIAKQVAEALEAAHEQGIIHRDLKPANIKVRSDGTVKVLDFGLAKALGPPEGDGLSRRQAEAEASALQTITTPAMTRAGVILGTAAYMSPEQAKGKPLDRRADVWALGAVLYEMLTGRRAFTGEDVTDTIVSVLSKEPDWLALPANTPATIRKLLRRCLEKDRKRRLDSAADARLELEDSLTAPSSVDGAATSAASGGRRALIAAFTIVAVLLVALSVPAVRHLRESPPPAPPETRTDIVTPATTEPWSFALSPDGRQLAFVASGDGAARLWLRSLATAAARPLTGTEDAQFPFWSPDSRSVGFFAEGKLKRLDLDGGAPRAIAAAPAGRGGTWNADGVILFAPSYMTPLFRVTASGQGQPVAVTTLERHINHRFPTFLPDGRHFLFYSQGPADTAGVYLGSLDLPDTHRLTAADAAGVYLPVGDGPAGVSSEGGAWRAEATGEGGWLLLVRTGTLSAQRLDLDRSTLTGDPVTLADQVVVESGYNVAAVSTSADGMVAYRTTEAGRRQLAWVDRSGKALGLLGAADENALNHPAVSPDGQRAVVDRRVQGNTDIWLLDGTRTSRLTFDAAIDENPVWSPDGGRIVFDSTRTGYRDLYQKSSSGGAETLLLASPEDKSATGWSPDGRFLLYQAKSPQDGQDLWVLPLEGDRKPWVFLKTVFDEGLAVFSPDGRWVAYQSNESGRDEIYVRPFARPAASGAVPELRPGQSANPAGGQWQVSTEGGRGAKWRRDGKEIYYLGPTSTMMAAPITFTGATAVPGAPAVLFPARIHASGRQHDVTRDGRFLINTMLDDGASAPITLLTNWQPKGKQ